MRLPWRAMTAAFRAELETLRPYLLRYASLQLRDRDAAEDAVQEALAAALAGEKGFAGRANLKTWLTGILKHKIVDHIRRQSREAPLPGVDGETSTDDLDALFRRDGHWAEAPAAWPDPDGALETEQFRRALERCLENLPKKTARVFLMREHLGMETKDICQELGLTSTHCWVLLYRARMALRECLTLEWFAKT